jgi:hypothetical protein
MTQMTQRQKLMALPLDVLEQLARDALDALKQKRRLESSLKADAFHPGQRVTFQGRRGVKVIGTIESIKVTKAQVKCEDTRTLWRVPLHMLKEVPCADKPASTGALSF